jgi:hypothetical protein
LLRTLIYVACLRRKRPKTKPYKKCAIFKLDALGDSVLALGAIQSITRHFGEENCVLVCWHKVKEFMAPRFPAMEIVGAQAFTNLFDTLLYLRSVKQHSIFSEGVGLLISLRHHRSMHHDLILSAIPAETTVGAPDTPLSDFENDLIKKSLVRFDRLSKPISENGSDKCKELSMHSAVISCALGTNITPEAIVPCITCAASANNTGPKLVVTPFTGSAVRDISTAQLQEILSAVSKQCDVESVIVSSAADRNRSERMAAVLRAKGLLRVSSICTESLQQFIQILADATAVLTADSAPAHLATALDKPTVALIGGGQPGWFGYWRRSEKQVWLDHHVPCYGCNWYCIYNEAICITGISAKLAAAEIVRRLPVPTSGVEISYN